MPKMRPRISHTLLPAKAQFFSVAQTAERLGVHRRTVQLWIDCGKLRAIPIGNVFAIPRAEVERVKGDMEVA
jgi:excisionase family DNA binding protein